MNLERHLLEFLAAHEKQLLQFARELLAIPSPTPPGDERAVAERVQQELAHLGLPKPDTIGCQPERPNLLLKLTGRTAKPSLIINGHLDTKPPGNRAKWRYDPFDPVIEGNRLYGLGSSDMKGAVAAMVYAAGAVNEVRDRLSGELQLLLSADEEGGSAFGVKYLAAAGHLHADAALIGEASGVRRELEYLHLASRGLCCFRIRVYGDQMHSSLADEFKAVNATIKAAELLTRFTAEFKRAGVTLNAGAIIQGGVFFGVVPGLVEFGCDLRVPPGTPERPFRDSISSWLALQHQRDPELRAEVSWESPPTTWIDPVEFPPEHPLVGALQAACAKVLDTVPPIGCFPAATDAPWFYGAGIPAIPAFGPGLLPLAHSPNESVEISSISACARIYALAATAYLK